MRRDVIETIQGIEIYPLISLVIFVAFFIGLIYYVVRLRKSDIDRWKDMPLDDDEPDNEISNDSKPKGE
ncbi:MAG: cbb3-type cytochrome c oxidase subunit 3 [Balneolales bacterium]|nr:cbb3-type cytochrome c oxidase subunit 3 [Balneolales bacterium]